MKSVYIIIARKIYEQCYPDIWQAVGQSVSNGFELWAVYLGVKLVMTVGTVATVPTVAREHTQPILQ